MPSRPHCEWLTVCLRTTLPCGPDENSLIASGGAVYAESSGSAVQYLIAGTAFVNNSASASGNPTVLIRTAKGGGLSLLSTAPSAVVIVSSRFEGNTLFSNVSETGSGLYGAGAFVGAAAASIAESVFVSNSIQ